MNDIDLSPYSFVPVLGLNGAVVAVPDLDLSDSSSLSGSVNEKNDSSLPAPDLPSDLQVGSLSPSSSDIQLIQDVGSVLNESALSTTVPSLSSSSPVSEIGTLTPVPLLFNGAVWISGSDSSLGDVTLYFPVDSKPCWGLDSNGYLVYIGSSSVSGYLSGVYNNSISASSFSYPRYRTSNGYDYQYIHLIPTDSNAPIAVSESPRISMLDALPFLAVALLGVIVLSTSRLLR